MADPFDYAVRFPLRVGAVVRLAREHRQGALAELGVRLDQLGFVGRPGFMSRARWGPNHPEESAMRWLTLSRAERQRYADKDGAYLSAIWIADTMAEMVRAAVRSGEITLVEGQEAATDTLELRDGGILHAMRVEFREDRAEATSTPVKRLERPRRPMELDRVTQAMLAHIRTGIPTPPGAASPIEAGDVLEWLKTHKKALPELYTTSRSTAEKALKIVAEILFREDQDGSTPGGSLTPNPG